MKIIKNPLLVKRIEELNDINNLNMSLSDIFLNMTGKYDNEIIKTIVASKNQKETFLSIIADILEIDLDNDEDLDIWNSLIKPSLIEKDLDSYKDNPYIKSINFVNKKIGNYSLEFDHYNPYEIFPLDDIKVDSNYIEHTSLAYFRKEYKFPVLNESNVTWMSLNPNEIETMNDSINNAFGNIIVYGLGLGYFAFMTSLKESVKQITIIEQNEKVIKLFKDNILPQFNNKNKITIIQGNAFDYIKTKEKYDYAFADLWHSAEDGIIPFLKFKKNEVPGTKYDYWLENSFYAFIRRCFITLLYEQYIGNDASNYKQEQNVFDHLVNELYKKTINLTINDVDDLNKLLLDKNLLNIIL